MINQITLLQPSGVMVLQKSFEDVETDELIFSGFMAAVLSFSLKMEIGKLSRMTIGKNTYWFENIASLIIVIETKSTVDTILATTFFAKLKESNEFKKFAGLISSNVYLNLDSEEVRVLERILMDNIAATGLVQRIEFRQGLATKEAVHLKEIFEELLSGKSTPKELANRIFGESFEFRKPELLQKNIYVLQEVVKTGQIHKSLKKQLERLLQYLQQTYKGAEALGFFTKEQLSMERLRRAREEL
ncbi:MAG: hypothetical protein ACFFGZ_07825 [Candidatus Thorarchaeota archaeon]